MKKPACLIAFSALIPLTAPADELLALWTFNQKIDLITSGMDFHANADFVAGRPYIEMLFADIDTNGSDGVDYTDVRGIFHDSPQDNDAIRWDDIDESGFGELRITLSTVGYEDLTLRMDIRHRDNSAGATNTLEVFYSLNGLSPWTYVGDLTVIDDDSYHPESITFFTVPAVEDAEQVTFRILPESGSSINKDVYFDNIEITGDRKPNDIQQPALIASESATTDRLDVREDLVSQVTGVIGDPTDPMATEGIEFVAADFQGGPLLFSTSTSNTTVAPLSNIDVGPLIGGTRKLTIEGAAVGYATVTVTVSDSSGNQTNYFVDYAATAASSTPDLTRYHAFQADASTAVDAGPDHMIAADDENQTLRLYDRKQSGVRLKGWNFSSALGLASFQEADLEASTLSSSGTYAYWLGSHSNDSDGNLEPDREVLFATEITNTGANTNLTYVNRYNGLRDDLIDWDVSNGHGLGVSALGFFLSASNGSLPESTNGFNIEGLALMPGGGGAYVGFRAPLTPGSGRTNALIVPVTNFGSLARTGSGPAIFGAPIELDLGGRGIRSLARTETDEYLILAGPVGSTGTFALYLWDGNAASSPVLLPTDIDNRASEAGASPEALLALPDSFDSCSNVQVLLDGGDLVLYGDSYRAKRHPKRNLRKFRSDFIEIPAQSNTYTVTNTESAGRGSLRNAILCANDTAGQQAIQFDLGTGSHTITLFSEIPITDDLVIEGDPDLQITISGNAASRIFTVDNAATIEISNLRLIDGISTNDGGAIHINSGDVLLERCELSGHLADERGGAIYVENANLSIRDSTISASSSGTNGGAINANTGSTLNMVQSTISGNSSGHHGGGLFAKQGTVRIVSSTVTRNTADTRDGGFDGGGIRRASGTTTFIYVGNSVIAENTDASTFGDIHPDVSGDFLSLGHNFIGITDGSTGLDLRVNNDKAGDSSSPLEPQLSALQLNGGGILTHKPLFNSPLVEAANPDLFSDRAWNGNPPAEDQRGNARIQNANPDIGTIEFIPILVEARYTGLVAAESPENNRTGSISLTRNRSLNEMDVSFTILPQGGGAAFSDLSLEADPPASASGGIITFPAGISELVVNVVPVDDTLIETDEPVNIQVLDGTYHIRDISFPVDTITIFDNDFLVANFNDSGPGSLRDAVDRVELFGGGLVTFDNTGASGSPEPKTISLASPISILGTTVIEGPANNAAGLLISGGGVTRLFQFGGQADAVLRNLTLADGSSAEGGAIRLQDSATVLIDGCSLINNHSSSTGGAIFSNSSDSLTLRNSTISGNSAVEDGGGIYLSGTKLTLENSTVTDNLADSLDKGIGLGGGLAEVSSVVNVKNTIIAGNRTNIPNGAMDFSGVLLSRGGNLVGTNDGVGANSSSIPAGIPNANGDFVGTTKAPVEARLFPLSLKGGPTPVHHPGFNSLALDRAVAGAPAVDQRGLPRPFNGLPDIGAVEHQYLNYSYWKKFSFPFDPDATAFYAADLDWDGDGQTSGLERIFATYPDDPGSTGILRHALDGSDLLVVFTRAMWVDPADVGGEASTDLSNWGSGSLSFEIVTPPDPESLHPQMRLRIPRKNDKVFGRIFDIP